MTSIIALLDIPVPPEPVLEQAVGYQNNHNARYLALWWEPAGDEAMVSDGFVTYTGHWPGYLAYTHHKTVSPFLSTYHLGSAEEPAEHYLLFDLLERQAYIARIGDAEKVLAEQWALAMAQSELATIPAEYIDVMLEEFLDQVQFLPAMDELMCRLDEEQKAVKVLHRWLDKQANLQISFQERNPWLPTKINTCARK